MTETVEGTIKSVVYHNDENGYTVLHVEVPSDFELARKPEITLVGKTRVAWAGEDVRAVGEWVTDAVHGRQFKCRQLTCIAPRSLKGIEKYLASGLIKGIGPVLAKRIVDTFGEETMHVLSHQSGRLAEVPKLGRAKIRQIREGWKANEAQRETMIFGQTYGISVTKMSRIVRQYGGDTIATIKGNPYLLCRDIWGIGFKTADAIALNLGIAKDSPLRARAAIYHTLKTEADEEGHCWALENELLLHANELTEASLEVLGTALAEEIAAGHLIAEGEANEPRRIYQKSLYYAEVAVARRVRTILGAKAGHRSFDPVCAIDWWQSQQRFELAVMQREALEKSLKAKFSIITGGPGVGKTTIIRALVEICRQGSRVILAAPTGRAAKRMTEAVGAEAVTIHRLLKWNPATNRFTYNAENRLEGDVFIFDETSMIDINLASDLLAALPDAASVVWVGDTDQLPSVGPGSVLGDLIKSGAVPATRLNFIFRQDKSGLIVRNAHHVNAGEPLELRRDENSDFFFMRCEDPQTCLQRAIEFMQTRIPRKFGMDPLRDVQVLAPMRRNLLGTDNLNLELQKALNPNGAAVIRGGTTFRVGDRVMQLRNDYDKDVYNGDVGFVQAVSAEDRSLTVVYDGRPVRYEAGDLDELVLAYACTIHKSQGSEYPAVIILLHTQHYMMLQRNLLYTAITRGKRLVLLIGVPYAVKKAIETNKVRERRTSLAERLRLAMP